jgi:hypothetical protein
MKSESYRRPTADTIKQQLDSNRDEAEKQCLVTVLRERIRVLENTVRAGRWDASSDPVQKETRLQQLMSALEGDYIPDPELVKRVYRNGGHFLLRFARGVLLQVEDPDMALSFLQKPEHQRPTSWICVSHEGHIVPLRSVEHRSWFHAKVR